MSGVNKVTVMGHLGQDPEMRYMQSGDAVCNLSIATSETFKDKEGNKQERTEWHRVVLFRRIAEVAGEYLKKGSMAYIEGKLQTRKWTDKEGVDRYTTEIVGDRLQLVGGNGNNRDNRSNGGNGNNRDNREESRGNNSNGGNGNRNHASNQSTGTRRSAPPPADDIYDDDIPF